MTAGSSIPENYSDEKTFCTINGNSQGAVLMTT
jgi:hypothetical protein